MKTCSTWPKIYITLDQDQYVNKNISELVLKIAWLFYIWKDKNIFLANYWMTSVQATKYSA